MFKTISALVLAASVFAAPAMASTVTKTEKSPAAKHVVLKPSVANANAKMTKTKKHHATHSSKSSKKVAKSTAKTPAKTPAKS
ncbi:MAG: hypothetical protein EKK40_16090 [Bradyrhizobiaceae bacterium]|nr:MAG: hypothetical protein EKK40_16090 [Bradyrhizobiaceae bacterium]